MEIDESAVLWSGGPEERAGSPLLVLMHGLGSNERDLVALVPHLPTEFAIASVRAPLTDGPGFAWFPRDPQRPGNPRAEVVDAPVDALREWLLAQQEQGGHPFIGLLGFSQGGAMATHSLRRDPEIARFAVNLSGFVIEGEQPGDARLAEQRPPLFWGFGTVDPIIPNAAVERTAAWVQEHTTPVVRAYEGLGHSISMDEVADLHTFLRARLATGSSTPAE